MMAYCTVEQVRREIITEKSADNDLIGDAITQASDWINRYTKTTFEVGKDSTRYFRIDKSVDGRLLTIAQPLCALTSVTNTDGTVIDSSDYQIQPLNWQVEGNLITGVTLKRSVSVRWKRTRYPEEDLIAVVGRWGYSVDVPPLIERAAIRLATFMYKQRESGVLDTVAIPEAGIVQMPAGFPKEVRLMLRGFIQRKMETL